MEPTSVTDDSEFWLPPEFLTDDDFLVEKENNGGGTGDSNKCLFPYEKRHGFESFGLGSGFGSTGKPLGDEENFLPGLTRQMVQSSLEDDFSGGFCGNHAFPAVNDIKALGTTRSRLCGAGIGCVCRNQRLNQNRQWRVSSPASSWDLYCAATEEMARMNINDEPYGYNNHSGRGLPSRHPLAAAKNSNNGSGYQIHQSLRYQKLQAIQFQQLKQQQLMRNHRQMVQQSRGLRVDNNKSVAPVELSSSAWSNQPPRRDGSGMRAVFLGKSGSTGTGVFLPRRVNRSSPVTAKTHEKPTLATVLVPARVAQVLNLDEYVVQPVVRSSPNLNGDASWRQRSNNGIFSSQMKMEQTVNEPRLPSEWAY
ncbi:hypothetical protein EUTSA_v10010478mg [Eutrema salsugineum]|uniref:TIP41-like protein n=1 Tax=Eutrema salsugineum TaxID=72664 RepID=V4LYV2_EUTSA|nr:uncharacterized protein LOC18021019 [Eutrema salsugineum]ESQ45083.1 hypothetical protein EUTSA_v10010478mg [Eutrema salsugineum]